MNDETTMTSGTAQAEPSAKQEPAAAAAADTTPKTYTQDDIDRIVAQQKSIMQRKFEKELQTAREEGRTEAEKLAKMTEEQRVQHEREKAEADARKRKAALDEKEAELNRRELKANAIEILREKKLATGLADILDYTNADTVKASMDTIEKVVQDAIEAGVNARLNASRTPLRRAGASGDDLSQQVRAAMGLK